jgi:hypothetical protein
MFFKLPVYRITIVKDQLRSVQTPTDSEKVQGFHLLSPIRGSLFIE